MHLQYQAPLIDARQLASFPKLIIQVTAEL